MLHYERAETGEDACSLVPQSHHREALQLCQPYCYGNVLESTRTNLVFAAHADLDVRVDDARLGTHEQKCAFILLSQRFLHS